MTPIISQDCFDVEGINTNAGLVSWLPYRALRNSCIAEGLLAAGAILYVKTSSSQALLMVESINNIFGTVKNPRNLKLSVGGSSGGEGALLAAKGSILGSGTDGGGSLRFPAAFCGVCKSIHLHQMTRLCPSPSGRLQVLIGALGSFKPSKERMPGRGVSGPRSGSESVNAGLGPLAKTVAGLELWLRAQLEIEPWNEIPGCLPMPWNFTEAQRCTKKLTVGVILDDGIVQPTPPVTVCLRAV